MEVLEKLNVLLDNVIDKYHDTLYIVIHDKNDIRYLKEDSDKIINIMPKTIFGQSDNCDFMIGLNEIPTIKQKEFVIDMFELDMRGNGISIEKINNIFILNNFYVFDASYWEPVDCYVRYRMTHNVPKNSVLNISEMMKDDEYYETMFDMLDSELEYKCDIYLTGEWDSLSYANVNLYDDRGAKIKGIERFKDFVVDSLSYELDFSETGAGSSIKIDGRIKKENDIWKMYIDNYEFVEYEDYWTEDITNITIAILKDKFIKEIKSYLRIDNIDKEILDKVFTTFHNCNILKEI